MYHLLLTLIIQHVDANVAQFSLIANRYGYHNQIYLFNRINRELTPWNKEEIQNKIPVNIIKANSINTIRNCDIRFEYQTPVHR